MFLLLQYMNTSEQRIRLDLNSPIFQEKLFRLQKQEQLSLLGTLRRLSQMTWSQLYGDHGLKWELIRTQKGPNGERLYTFRIAQSFRAVAIRDGDWLRLLSLHPDHDSAYE